MLHIHADYWQNLWVKLDRGRTRYAIQ